jgi:hypothetical protein
VKSDRITELILFEFYKSEHRVSSLSLVSDLIALNPEQFSPEILARPSRMLQKFRYPVSLRTTVLAHNKIHGINGMEDLQNHFEDVTSLMGRHHEQREKYEALRTDFDHKPV